MRYYPRPVVMMVSGVAYGLPAHITYRAGERVSYDGPLERMEPVAEETRGPRISVGVLRLRIGSK